MSELREEYEQLKSQIWVRIRDLLSKADQFIDFREYEIEIDFINSCGQLFTVYLTGLNNYDKLLYGIDDEDRECTNSLYDIITVDDRLTILELLEEIYNAK